MNIADSPLQAAPPSTPPHIASSSLSTPFWYNSTTSFPSINPDVCLSPEASYNPFSVPSDSQRQERQKLSQAASTFLKNSEYIHRSEKMGQCGQVFRGRGKSVTYLCEQTGCCFCAGERLARTRSPLLDRIASQQYSHEWQLLPVTFTVRSVRLDHLGEAFDTLADGCRGVMRNKPFSDALGTVFSKEVTVNGDFAHPHTHGLIMFPSMEQTAKAIDGIGHQFQRAADIDYNPYVWTGEPVSGHDLGAILRLAGYATKLPSIETCRELVRSPERYLSYYRAVNGRRPGRTKTQLVSMTDVFSPRNTITPAKLAAMPASPYLN